MAAGRGAGGERLVAVVLFTDLVGSTELRARVGEEAAEELRRTHDRVLAQAVEANSGRVVKGLGDGIMATFTGASDAVAAAVAIQQAIDRLNRSAQAVAALEVRVGISAGDVTMEDDDVHGTPVIEAARLCAAAGGEEILASEMVRWLARSSAATLFTPVGELDLKGLPEPVPAVRVEWEPLATSAIPMPNLLTDVGRIFVGRDDELERLGQLWKEAAAGERRVALLAGEPGVGKTRLAAELATRVHDEAGVVLAGRCDEDLGVPYQPFVESLRHFVDHTAAGDLAERLGRYGGELVRLLPELAERRPDLASPLTADPETERYRLFDAVAAWLAAASSEEPAMLLLDDLQWAAKPTLLLLRHVVRAPEAMRLVILGAYRDTELHPDHPLVELLADLHRLGGIERLSLSGFDRGAVADFMAQAAGHDMDDDGLALASAIHAETDGNPFFVQEILRHLAETEAVVQRDGRWVSRLAIDDIGIPRGVREVVGRRVSRLSSEANHVLRVAAVVGTEFELSVVKEAGEVADDTVFSAVEEAVAARLVVESPGPPPRHRFAHALVRDTLYDQLSAARRVALHRRVGEAIESLHAADLDQYLPALAHHWARASAAAADRARAVDYAARAGDRALAQLANDEAVAYYRQALELLDVPEGPADVRRRVEVLISLGEAERRAGDPNHRGHLLEAARLAEMHGDAESLARAALAGCRGAFSAGGEVDLEQVTGLERALEAVGDRHDALKARLLASLALELTWGASLERRLRLSDEAVTLARRVGGVDILSSVLHSRAAAIWDVSTVAERLHVTAEALTIAERLGDPQARFWALYRGFVPLLELGRLEDAGRHAMAADQVAEELGQPFLRMLATYIRATWLIAVGRLADSEWVSHAAGALGEQAGQPDAPFFALAQAVNIRYEQGRFDDTLPAQLAGIAERVPGLPVFRAMLALAQLEIGRIDDARSVFDILAVDDFRGVPRDNLWSPTMAMASTVCAGLRDEERATNLYQLIVPYEDLVSAHALMWFGAFNHHLGILDVTLGRVDDAADRFAAAASTHNRAGARASEARTQLEWARTLLIRRQSDDVDRSRKLLGKALDTARELGLANVERRAVGLLEDGP